MLALVEPMADSNSTGPSWGEVAHRVSHVPGPSITIRYHAPCPTVDEHGNEVIYFIKEQIWESYGWSRAKERRVFLCSIRADGSDRKEICRLNVQDEGLLFDLLWPPYDHLEVNLETGICALGSEYEVGMAQVLIFSMDGVEVRRLSPHEWETQGHPHGVGYPTASPDGQWVAFVENVWIKGGDYWRIAKCRPDGTGYCVLTPFDRFENDIQPAWSPKDDQIAYIHGGRGRDELRVMDTNGNIQWRLASKFRWVCPRWSPDGTQVLLNGHDLVDIGSREVSGALRTDVPHSARWCEDGFVFPQDGIQIAQLDGSTPDILLKNTSRPGRRGDLNKAEFRW